MFSFASVMMNVGFKGGLYDDLPQNGMVVSTRKKC